MKIHKKTTHLWRDIYLVASANRAMFIIVWGLLFVTITSFLITFGFVPDALAELTQPTIVDASTEKNIVSVDTSNIETMAVDPDPTPKRIIIDAVGTDVSIESPNSRDIAVLDDSLTRGAVQYPGSGDLDDISNMFLFGHSSLLPFVKNPAYKAFNNVENLKEGDIIRVQSASREYRYSVTSVVEIDARDAWVQFNTDKKKLTLSTCNNFGSVQDRFVVEADFIGSYDL